MPTREELDELWREQDAIDREYERYMARRRPTLIERIFEWLFKEPDDGDHD